MTIFKYPAKLQGAKETSLGFNMDEMLDFKYVSQEIPQASGSPTLYEGLFVRLKGKLIEKVPVEQTAGKGRKETHYEKQENFVSHYIEDPEAIQRFFKMIETF